MRKKDETFSEFIEFKALVEKETKKKVKTRRSDKRGEYMSNELKNLYAKEGIRRELISPHNPQHNGVAKWKNHIIVGAMRDMLHDYLCICGPRHATQWSICITRFLIRFLA